MKPELNVLNKQTPLSETELQADLLRMQRDVKRHLKTESKNNLIRMIQHLTLELYIIKEQIKTLTEGVHETTNPSPDAAPVSTDSSGQ